MEWVPIASPHLDSPWHLEPLVRELEKVANGETIEVCVSVPPRHGKTTLIVHWIVWLLLQKPDLRVLYCSYGSRMAQQQTRAMRALARRVGLPMGEIQRVTEWTTAGGGSVKACGITGPPTGDGYDVIVVDDPHRSRQAAESALERESVVTAYRDDVYTRQLPRGTSHVVVHTRWHEADLIGVLTRKVEDGPRPFRLINLPAIDADGNALAPSMWPIEKLRRIEQRLGPYAWASLYQGAPRPKGGTLFGAPVWTDRVPFVARYVGGVDLARTAKTRSDYQAAVVLAVEPDGSMTVVDIEHEQSLIVDRRDVDTGHVDSGFARRLHELQRRWRGCQLRMYAGGGESTLVDLLATHRDWPVTIRQVKATADKWDRAQPTAAAWNRGQIKVLNSLRHGDELVRQLQRFTGLDGESDDLVDALVAAFDEASGAPVLETIGTLDTRWREKPSSAYFARRGGRLFT